MAQGSMSCPNCGAASRADLAFCESCGTRLQLEQTEGLGVRPTSEPQQVSGMIWQSPVGSVQSPASRTFVNTAAIARVKKLTRIGAGFSIAVALFTLLLSHGHSNLLLYAIASSVIAWYALTRIPRFLTAAEYKRARRRLILLAVLAFFFGGIVPAPFYGFAATMTASLGNKPTFGP